MRHPQLGAKGKELIGRGLLEIVGADVSNIRPRNWQCIHSFIPCVEVSVIGQTHGHLETFRLGATPRGGRFGHKNPSD